jgi:hypothetical protein
MITSFADMFKTYQFDCEIWGFHGGKDDDVVPGFGAV